MPINLKKRILTSIFLFILLTLMYFYSFVLIISLIIISIIVWIEFLTLISKIFLKSDFKNQFIRIVLKAISLLYISMISFLIFSYQNSSSSIIISYILCIAIASDIGGLIVGKTLKGKKLTKISPKKTISGSIGAFIFSLMLIPFFFKDLLFNNLMILFLITLIISLSSQLGDLFISFLKRKAKVKDTSNILPGHGGFLDRVDGIIAAIPVGIILFKIF